MRTYTAKSNWEGLSLTNREPSGVPHVKVDQRWREYSEARRTVEPDYPVKEEREYRPHSMEHAVCSNLSDLIARKDSYSDLGNSKKAVHIGGRVIYSNATSQDNFLNSESEANFRGKEIHKAEPSPPRRFKKQTDHSEESRLSQINFLPGPSRNIPEKALQIRSKPDMESQIVELPGYLKRDPAEPWFEQPLKKYGRFTSTSVENEYMFGEKINRSGPMIVTTPQRYERSSAFTRMGEEADLIPSCKATSAQAKQKIFGESTQEVSYNSTRKARPPTVPNAFSSSDWLANKRNSKY
mmetsp:Transcript_137/g.170  ORF Transcript_137/g.170 Transcript_137/m.170 type:complete len:296 (+) Transcript_137:62-949(+)